MPSSATTSSPFVQSWLDEFASGFQTVNQDGGQVTGLFEGLKRSVDDRASREGKASNRVSYSIG